MQRVYGLTSETIKTYQSVVRMGYSWELAMRRLKYLYEHNKQFYTEHAQRIQQWQRGSKS